MKKNLFFIILAALCSLGSAAQNDGSFGFIEEKPKSNALFVGPTIGGTMTMTSGQTADYDLIDGGGFGFTGGVAARARFGRATENSIEGTGMLGVGLEVKYKLNSVKTHAEDKLSLGYLEIPVTIQFFPLAKMHGLNGLYIEAGPDFAMLTYSVIASICPIQAYRPWNTRPVTSRVETCVSPWDLVISCQILDSASTHATI